MTTPSFPSEYRIPPALITIEVTEHVLLERGAELVTSALRRLNERQVSVALDDFGTGPSSFAHLRDYPVHELKIAPSFVSRMAVEEPILAIVKAIAELGPSLNVAVVAEGIETEEQREILQGAGCRTGQGFLFSPPVPATEVAEMLRTRKPTNGHGKLIPLERAARVV